MLATKPRYTTETNRAEEHFVERKHTTSTGALTKSAVWERVATFACIAASTGAMWAIAQQGARIDSANYQIDRSQQQVQQVAAVNAITNAQVDKLEQPSRILNVAVNQLHMKYASPVQISATTQAENH